MNECLMITGKVSLKLYDENNVLKDERKVNNLVVTSGLYHIAKRLVDSVSPNQMQYMALGDDNTAAVAGDTLLLGEINGSRSLLTPSENNGVITYSHSFGQGVGTGELKEAGIFNNSEYNTTTMLCRAVFPTITKGALDTLSISWQITISAPA